MTLAYYGKSRKRGVGLALAAILAIIVGTVVGAGTLGGGTSAYAWSHTLDVVTVVNGGTHTAGDFSIYVHNSGGTNTSGSPHAGQGAPGTAYGLEQGMYTVGVSDPMGYSVGFSGDCASGGSVNIDTDTVHTCTVTLTSNAVVLESPLQLTSMCSDNPDVSRHWRVRNPNSTDVAYTWEVVGTTQTGSGTATANSDVFFDTQTVAGPNTTKISWMDNGVEKSTVKASGGAACAPSTLTGSITINKYFVEADGTTKATDNLPSGVDFTYTGPDGGGSFTLTADKGWTWGRKDAPTGYYHFDEASIPGWHTVGVHCYSSAVSPRSAVAPEADASFTLNEGESWTCDFTNQRVEQSSQTYTVTIAKYISLDHATATNANGASFSMHADWTGGTGDYALDQNGFNGGSAYEAITGPLPAGSSYSTNETGVPMSAEECQPGDAFYLSGYGVGTSLANAAANVSSQPAGAIPSLNSDMYIVVVNQPCQQSNVGGTITINKLWEDANGSQTSSNLPASVSFSYTDPSGMSHDFTLPDSTTGEWTWTLPEAPTGHYSFQEMTADGWHTVDAHCSATPSTLGPETVEADASFTMKAGENWTCTFTNRPVSNSQTYRVTIAKYISGDHADATNAANTTFTMNWSGTLGSGSYPLDPNGFNGGAAYEAMTSPMVAGSTYATSETGVPTSPDQCRADTPYYLAGYRVSSTSMADAATAPLSPDSPNFTNLQANQYVIVANQPCQAQNLVGSITIVKSWEDANGQPMTVDSSQIASFTGTGTGVDSSFDLTSAGGYSHQFFGLNSETYTFTEAPITGWTLTGITCTSTSLSVPTYAVAGSMLSIAFNNTEGMTCTFHNQQQAAPSGASLTIVKEWRDASGNVMETGFGTASFTSDVTDHASFMLGTGNSGASNVNQLVISGITPGTYHITEAGQAGWNFVSSTCTNNAMQNTLVPSSSFGVVVPENGDITCTVVNQAVAGVDTFVPIPSLVFPGQVTIPAASPSASPSETTTSTAPANVPGNTGSESPSTNTGNTGVGSQPSNINNNAPSANNAVAGVQAPGAPSTGSGSSSSDAGNTLAITLGILTIAASGAAYALSRKNRS